jgi:CO/xanthine dehydrogenase Mo-binding subunit
MAIDHHDSPSPFSALGSKGAGENCAMSAPAAIAGAVEDALRDYRAAITELPITQALIWRELNGVAR